MAQTRVLKYKKSEIYKGVSYIEINDGFYYQYQLTINGVRYKGTYKTEKEAAISYDMKLIDNGKQPVNVLKKNV